MIEDLENEIWKDVVGYEGHYMVSNLGRVKSIKIHNSHGTVMKERRNKLKKVYINERGYCKVSVIINSQSKRVSVHRLVAMAFITNPENKPQVNHIDGIRNNNYVENLEWCTATENVRHAWDNGLNKAKKGEEVAHTRLTNEEVIEIKKLYRSGMKIIDIHRNNNFNCSYGSMIKITAGLTWAHIKI